MNLKTTTLLLGVHAALLSGGAHAAEGASAIEEIVVTARRREERLQDVPVAVSAFTGAQIEERGLQNIQEVGRFVPGMDFSSGQINGGGFNSQLTIRGIGQTDFLITTDPGVGTYVDGVYYARTMGGVLDVLDLERIEVLRGPQGTLFGKNTIGGAVNIVSAKPDGEFAGRAELTLGNWNRIDARASVNLPVIEDTLFARVAVSSKNNDGYGRESDGSRTGDEDVAVVRGSLRWVASQDVEVLLAADTTRQRQGHLPVTMLDFVPNAGLAGLYNFVGSFTGLYEPYQIEIPSNPLKSNGAGRNVNDLDSWGVSATVDWKVDDRAALKSITAYRELSATWGADLDGSASVHVNEVLNDDDQWQVSQEFQLSGRHMDDRLDWILGVFYFRENATDRNNVRFALPLYEGLEALPGALIPIGPGLSAGGAGNPLNALFDVHLDVYNEIDITSMAGFGHATYDLTDDLSVFGGLRYSYEKKDYFLAHYRIDAETFAAGPKSVDESWNTLSPKVGANYKVTDELMLFASFSHGFKSGGFNGRPTTGAEATPYDPEYVSSYELGMKSTWLDRRVILNLAGFYYDYTDIQLTGIYADNFGNLLTTITNAAEATIQGVELEIQARLAEGLDVSATAAYLDAGYDDIGTATQITLDSTLPKTPEWTASLAVQYTAGLGDAGSLILQADGSYKSKTYPEIQNYEITAQPGFALFNARIIYRSPDESWELALYGKNLSDEEYLLNGTDARDIFGIAYAFPGRPREWGLTLSANF